MSTTRPPGYTCPAIDKAKQGIRRALWRARRLPASAERDALVERLVDALPLLEVVRDENRAMRAAWYEMRALVDAANAGM